MTAAGKIVLHSDGKIGVLSSGKTAVFDSAGACAECCEENPCFDCAASAPGVLRPTGNWTQDLSFVGFDSALCEWTWEEVPPPPDEDKTTTAVLYYDVDDGWVMEAYESPSAGGSHYSSLDPGATLTASCIDGVLSVDASLDYGSLTLSTL